MYKILMQQRKIEGMGLRISVHHTYFGEAGDSDGLAPAPERYFGNIIDWKEKRSNDPKIKVKFDGESCAVPCPLETLLNSSYSARLEPGLDGTPAPVLTADAPRPRARPPAAPAAARATGGGGGDWGGVGCQQ